ncbi:MAG: hypothetical protein P4M11_13365, partial [Candidatus Pacebacteria bacterium]|nr:hypothetical protein [Candidatus Paceibacterota bacterium]
ARTSRTYLCLNSLPALIYRQYAKAGTPQEASRLHAYPFRSILLARTPLLFWKEVATKTILPRSFSDVQCCVLNSRAVYIFQRNIDMSNTNTFAVYHIGTN